MLAQGGEEEGEEGEEGDEGGEGGDEGEAAEACAGLAGLQLGAGAGFDAVAERALKLGVLGEGELDSLTDQLAAGEVGEEELVQRLLPALRQAERAAAASAAAAAHATVGGGVTILGASSTSNCGQHSAAV